MRGMERTIERARPLITSDYAPENLRNISDTEPSAYLDWFRARGYSCAIIEPDGSATDATQAEIDLRVAAEHHLDLAFTPEG